MHLVTYNCKNLNTAVNAIKDLSHKADIIMLQEHWYFDCQLSRLESVHPQFTGVGKAVDTGDPILPVQMPRGYGGVGVLWKKDIEHLVTVIPEGGNRIQCIEVNGEEPMLLISVYLPCRGVKDNYDDFCDCLDQVNEIIQKYSETHMILVGGDFNEDLVNEKSSRRTDALNSFINENQLMFNNTSKTYTNPDGVDVSTIDYVMYRKTLNERVISVEVINELHTNVSDHYPVKCCLRYELQSASMKKEDSMKATKVKWEKLDSDLYVALVNEGLDNLDLNKKSLGALDNALVTMNCILAESAQQATPRSVKRPRKAKLKVWSADVRKAISNKKEAFYAWKSAGRPTDKSHRLVVHKKDTTRELRRICRVEIAQNKQKERQEILDTKSHDMALFHKLINKQRGKLKNCINELHVGDKVHKTPESIIGGWHDHFGQLATTKDSEYFDQSYHNLVVDEMRELQDLNDMLQNNHQYITSEQVRRAVKLLNSGKALDAYGVSAEHFKHGGEQLIQTLVNVLNKILDIGEVTESMKLGTLTPVYKKKGSSLEAKNYRGITVTPALSKLLETVLREVIQPAITTSQNGLQRGFTANSSPMNCSLILDEVIREFKDRKEPVYVAFLDAKSAFDVVSHDSLMRKLFHIGVEGSPWTVINSIHNNAKTSVKWDGLKSQPYVCEQGVRQGGILSTDLYKVYVNGLLDRLNQNHDGAKIGEINCVAPTCADDVALLSSNPETLQSLINTAVDYSKMERYILQPTKSVILPINTTSRKAKCIYDYPWTLNGDKMPVVESTMHMGILRSAATDETSVDENIKKARRTIYSLMASGLHGENGLDPETSLHLMQTYILPVLIYGMEVILPKVKLVDKLEIVNKKFLKQILSLPTTVANPAVYILSGTIPVEGTIHKRALTLFGNISRLQDESLEKQIAERQLNVKNMESSSWFIAVKKILLKYELNDPLELLNNPPQKLYWKKTVNTAVNNFWKERIKQHAAQYSSLKYLNLDLYEPGKRHPLIENIKNEREINRVSVKMKMVTGTYILQVNRASFNQNQPDPVCMLCRTEDETITHFLLVCPGLSTVRQPILASVINASAGVVTDTYNHDILTQLILDCTTVVNPKSDIMRDTEYHCRRLVYALHAERYKQLALVPRKKVRGTRRHTPK
ncbi:MAG: reverse transcriptase family protein [Sedimenticola sp.]